MKSWAPIVILLTASFALAQAPAPNGTSSPEVDRLKSKATGMRDHERGKIYAEIARELTEVASRQFSDGDRERAFTTIKEIVDYSEKAAGAAKIKNKKTKDTEINLRRTARRLEEIEKSLAVEDRPPVRTAVERVDTIRKELLEFFLKRG